MNASSALRIVLAALVILTTAVSLSSVSAAEKAPLEAVTAAGVIKLQVGRSLVLRTKADMHRSAIDDKKVCDVVHHTPRELTLVARAAGQTQVTCWLNNPGAKPVIYTVEVHP